MSASPLRLTQIPPPDRHNLEQLNTLYDLSVPGPRNGWKNRLADRARALLARILFRQQEFNAALVDHVNRSALVAVETHAATTENFDRMRDVLHDFQRQSRELLEWWQRSDAMLKSISAEQEQLRASAGVLHHAVQTLKRETARAGNGAQPSATAGAAPRGSAQIDAFDSYKYVGFEDSFRGSPEDIRGRVAEYLPIFEGAHNVLDVGCGRGEFLSLLRERSISARGIDINPAMIDVCRQQGLDADHADALAFLRAQPDGSLGGLFAAQVVEHLEPRYLMEFLGAAFEKLRPGAPIVLETINVACWSAFFQSYIRDITHVRPVHPETLQYLLVASGFQQVDIRYRSPCPDPDKLQRLEAQPSLGTAVDTLNANVDRLNRLLFSWLDYAVVGRRA
jgi:O-antigen chain-terminating methyltransferase